MRPGHGLKVILGVPVAVKDDHSVGGGQVDAQAPSPGRQQEGKIPRAWRVEVLHSLQHNPSCRKGPEQETNASLCLGWIVRGGWYRKAIC